MRTLPVYRIINGGYEQLNVNAIDLLDWIEKEVSISDDAAYTHAQPLLLKVTRMSVSKDSALEHIKSKAKGFVYHLVKTHSNTVHSSL